MKLLPALLILITLFACKNQPKTEYITVHELKIIHDTILVKDTVYKTIYTITNIDSAEVVNIGGN